MNLKETFLLLLLAITTVHSYTAKRNAPKQKAIVCYYTSWSIYRAGQGKYNIDNLEPSLCTHLIYAFGGLKNNEIIPSDEWADISLGGYANFTGMKTKNPQLKTLLGIGGSNEGSVHFSNIVNSEENRQEFVKNATNFLRKHNFDGLDLDWQYPAFKDGSRPRDKENYVKLVQELKAEFAKESLESKKPELILFMTLPASLEYIDRGFDVPNLSKNLDMLILVTYDYYLPFEPQVNHHSALYSVNETDEDAHYDVNATVFYYKKLGADLSKILLGIPLYGRSFTLEKSADHFIGSAASGAGVKGTFTGEEGYLSYFEICANNWKVERPYPDAMGPYAYEDKQWVAFDDVEIIGKKAQYVLDNNLAGVSFWALDLDDFNGRCRAGKYPLISAAKKVLDSSKKL